MSNLVKRLRNKQFDKLQQEAADEIERLRRYFEFISVYHFEVIEPNEVDIPDHLDAYINELQNAVLEMQNQANAAQREGE